jgi:hypothetical protein
MVGEVGESHVVLNLPVTNVTGCIGSNAKTLGQPHLQSLDMGASGGHSDGTRIVLHGTDELLIQDSTIPDGKTLLMLRRGPSSPSLCAAFFLA